HAPRAPPRKSPRPPRPLRDPRSMIAHRTIARRAAVAARRGLPYQSRAMSDASSLFVVNADGFAATALSGSPWQADALHGGPPAALLSRAIERFEGGAGMFVARITFELMRPVPRTRLTLDTKLLRPGRKVQLVQASLFDGEREVMRATGLRIRRLE